MSGQLCKNSIYFLKETFFNHVFHRKTRVIKMMNVDGQAVVNISFPEIVRNILIVLGRILDQVNAECSVRE